MKKIFSTIIIFLIPLILFGINTNSKFVKVAFTIQLNEDEAIEDQQIFMEMYTTLTNVEKIANLLDAKLTIGKDKVENDVFIFSIKTDEQKNLAIKLIDEEGIEVGDNLFTINKGENYRTINTSNLKDGTYTFRLIDKDGNELQEEFIIDRK